MKKLFLPLALIFLVVAACSKHKDEEQAPVADRATSEQPAEDSNPNSESETDSETGADPLSEEEAFDDSVIEEEAEIASQPITQPATPVVVPAAQPEKIIKADIGYAVGQVWQLTDGKYGGHNVIICAIEETRKGTVLHLTIAGPFSAPGLGTVPEIAHLPFTLKAVKASSLINTGKKEVVSASFREGYGNWKAAYDKGDAGIWDQPIPEVLDMMISMVSAGEGEGNY